ncbi:MAG: DUF58 domain-containing protein [Lachnospiraceae bacterium]|nr:DUF58 domain-containing protein [Lachnospiraceae bacterium]
MKARRIILLILWILSVVAISFYGGAVSYGFFFCVTLLPVISLIYLICVYAGFRIYQEIESRNIVCRQPMPYYFVLHNGEQYAFAGVSARLFSGLSYVEEMPDDAEYELLPGDRYTFRTRLVCRYRGEYEVGVKEVTITDFFQIFQFKYKNPSTIKAVVYPRIIRKEELNSIREIAAYLCRENYRNRTEPDVVVRDYAAGDAMKHIHWKASAKEQKLKTRTLTGEEQQGLVFFYDTGRYSKNPYEYLPLENQILEILLGAGYFFAKQNVGFEVLYMKGGLRRCRVEGTGDYDGFYREAAQTVFDGSENGAKAFTELAGQGAFADKKAVIAILHRPDDGLMTAAKQLSESGVSVILYIVTDENIEEYLRQNSSRLQILAVPVHKELEDWL